METGEPVRRWEVEPIETDRPIEAPAEVEREEELVPA